MQIDSSAGDIPGITEYGGSDLWYHGSPAKLTSLRSGSTITRIKTLARAFSHKPEHVIIEIEQSETSSGRGRVTLTQDGLCGGYLYKVFVNNQEADTMEDPDSVMFPGDEVLTSRELPVELLEEIPLRVKYEISKNCIPPVKV